MLRFGNSRVSGGNPSLSGSCPKTIPLGAALQGIRQLAGSRARGAAGFSDAAAEAPGAPAPAHESFYVRVPKRLLDIGISVAAMPVLGVMTAVFGTAIWLEDRGPVFYNAPRMGKDRVPFKMYKFRSMKVDAPDLVMEDGSTYNGADDPRMTRVGAFMRKSSIDEFPQFLNVLKGDMSVIGPRPDLERETELYQGDEGDKLLVRPGITGWAAVSGRNAIQWHDRLALDVEYVRNVSFLFDVKVFFLTFKTIFSQEGIYVEERSGL